MKIGSRSIGKSFPPFIKLYLDILFHNGEVSQLIKIIKKYWSESPSSSLRLIISQFLKKTKLDDIENIKRIVKSNTNQIESKKLILDFAIHNSDWVLARENVVGLINADPDREICNFMALLELGDSDDKQDGLNFSRRLRRTPFTSSVEKYGVKGFSVVNHALLPKAFSTSIEEDYWHLRSAVQIWDVGVQRQVEIMGPDASKFVQYMTP